jgi:hypothetical protein
VPALKMLAGKGLCLILPHGSAEKENNSSKSWFLLADSDAKYVFSDRSMCESENLVDQVAEWYMPVEAWCIELSPRFLTANCGKLIKI